MRTATLFLKQDESGADPANGVLAYLTGCIYNGSFIANPAQVPIPAGLKSNDFVLLNLSCGQTPTTPNEFLPITSGSSDSINTFYFYKIATLTDESNVITGSWNIPYVGDTYLITIGIYRGVNTAFPFVFTPSVVINNSLTIQGSELTGSGLYVQTITFNGNSNMETMPQGMSLRQFQSALGAGHVLTDAPLSSSSSFYPATQRAGFGWVAFAALLQKN